MGVGSRSACGRSFFLFFLSSGSGHQLLVLDFVPGFFWLDWQDIGQVVEGKNVTLISLLFLELQIDA